MTDVNPSIKPAKLCQSEVCREPLQDENNKSALRDFLQLIKTSIGPYGKLKIIQNMSGGHVLVTSLSSRLLQCTAVQNVFLKLIKASTNSHISVYGNGGLYCAILLLELLINSLNLFDSSPVVSDLNEYFANQFIQLMQSSDNKCVFNVDFSNISYLKTVVHNIIISKPLCVLSDCNKKHIELILLKAFLNSVPENASQSSNLSQNISFCKLEGANPANSQIFNGLLIPHCELPDQKHLLQCFHKVKVLKVALFSSSLAGDVEFITNKVEEFEFSVWNEVLFHLKRLAEKLVFDEVSIAVCQKVVHPVLKVQLIENGVLVIDRLGLMQMQAFEVLSGAVPVTSLHSSGKIIYGSVTSVSDIRVGKKSYFLLQNKEKPFWTVLICHFNEESLEETVAVCKQALDTLYRLLRSPKVCCGGGCVEVYTAYLLEQMLASQIKEIAEEVGCSSSLAFQAFENFLGTIISISASFHQRSITSFATETIYHHLWQLQDGQFPSGGATCACGMYEASVVDATHWQMLTRHHRSISHLCDEEKSFNFLPVAKQPTILDELSVKINALSIGFETSASLLRVKLSILNKN